MTILFRNKRSARGRVALVTALGLTTVAVPLGATEISGDAYTLYADDIPAEMVSWRVSGSGGSSISSETQIIYSDDPLADGFYQYAIMGRLDPAEVQASAEKQRMNSGRGADAAPINDPVGVVETGRFQIVDGSVSGDEAPGEGAAPQKKKSNSRGNEQ